MHMLCLASWFNQKVCCKDIQRVQKPSFINRRSNKIQPMIVWTMVVNETCFSQIKGPKRSLHYILPCESFSRIRMWMRFCALLRVKFWIFVKSDTDIVTGHLPNLEVVDRSGGRWSTWGWPVFKKTTAKRHWSGMEKWKGSFVANVSDLPSLPSKRDRDATC